MTTTEQPDIRLPTGFEWAYSPGGWEVVRSAEKMSKTVAFRVPTSTYAEMVALVGTFGGWGEALRWLLGHPDVRRVIAERLAAVTRDGVGEDVADEGVARPAGP